MAYQLLGVSGRIKGGQVILKCDENSIGSNRVPAPPTSIAYERRFEASSVGVIEVVEGFWRPVARRGHCGRSTAHAIITMTSPGYDQMVL